MIIYFIILSSSFANQITTKLCVNCKFYKKEFFVSNKFGKCLLFPKENDNDYFLVDGINNNNKKEFHYCSTSRKIDSMCGKEGKFYEKK
jgi:hypothetical protein